MASITPAVLNMLQVTPDPLDPIILLSLVENIGFQYRTLTGMLIFVVQIGRFGIAPTVFIPCRFNERPSNMHFLAANNGMRYLRATHTRYLMCWRPTGCERSDLPRGDIVPMHPKRAIPNRFPSDPPPPFMKPVLYVDASYGGPLPIDEYRSISSVLLKP
jgi:hypothetical protein